MMRVVLAGGGTAGHVNPLLAVADELVRQGEASPSDIIVIGPQKVWRPGSFPMRALPWELSPDSPFPGA